MYAIRKGSHKDQAPGTWWCHVGEVLKLLVMVKCPACGKIADISLEAGEHHIFSTGEVQPSLACPRDGCDFHEFVMLAGWPDDTPCETKDGA